VGRRASPTGSDAWTVSLSFGYLIIAVSSVAATWFAFKPFSVGTSVGRSISCGSSVASVYTRRLVPPSLVPCLSEAHRRQGYAVKGAIAAGIVLVLIVVLTALRRLWRSQQSARRIRAGTCARVQPFDTASRPREGEQPDGERPPDGP